MRAFVLTGRRQSEIRDVPAPTPAPGEAVVDIHRVGVCGTDMEMFSGEMQYLHNGLASYPVRLGHEWCGTVTAVGAGVDPSWIGCRATGDTQIGCGTCDRCRSGRQHVCANRFEVGLRGGFDGALAEQMKMPIRSLLPLPDSVDDAAGAMVEPGGNALRAVRGAGLTAGERLLIIGPGTIGLLASQFALANGCEVHLLGLPGPALDFGADLGVHGTWTSADLPTLRWDAVIDASNAATSPALALDLVEPGRRIVFIGLSESLSSVDTRTLALNDVTAVGVLSASPGLNGAIEAYANGSVDPRILVSTTIGLDDVPAVLGGKTLAGAGAAPKIHVDPRL